MSAAQHLHCTCKAHDSDDRMALNVHVCICSRSTCAGTCRPREIYASQQSSRRMSRRLSGRPAQRQWPHSTSRTPSGAGRRLCLTGLTTSQCLAAQACTVLPQPMQGRSRSCCFTCCMHHWLTSDSSLGMSAVQTAMPLIRPLRI